MFERNQFQINWALRIQQRAFLRLANLTAHNELKKLVPSYETLQIQLGEIEVQLMKIEERLLNDQHKVFQVVY